MGPRSLTAVRTPVQRRSLPDAVFEQLAGEIVSGQVAAGEALPSERELSEALQVNRGAVREGLTRLSHAGLVAVRHGGPTRVLDYRQSASLDLLGRLLFRADGRVDVDVARSVVEMRAALGPDIARLAARRSDAAVLAQLDSVVAAMAGARGQAETLQGLALEFWDHLVEGSGNIAYRLAFNSLRQAYEPVRELFLTILAVELTDVHGYVTIARRVGRRDADGAAAAAVALLTPGTRAMIAGLESLRGTS